MSNQEDIFELHETLSNTPINRLANCVQASAAEKEQLLAAQIAGFKAQPTKVKPTPKPAAPKAAASPIKLNDSTPAKEAIMPTSPTLTNPLSQSRQLADQITSIDQFVTIVKSFEGCSLKHTATNTVLFEGQLDAKIMLIGEAPGANEDLQGRPFCGDSGKLLDSFLATINLSRQENIIIVNSVFWRPPGNRKPTNEEIAICRPFLEKLIALINPELLVLVGSVAASSVLNQTAPMNTLRRKFTSYTNPYLSKEITTTVVFHPSYLLRQPLQKKIYWYDLLNLQEYIANNLNIKLNKLVSA